MHKVFEQIKKGLIVSCQADEGDPFDSPDAVALFAKAAEMAGAVGIRSAGIEKTKKIINTVQLPVIGLVKSSFQDGMVCITGSFKAVEELISIGCAIIAVDGTLRLREGLSGPEFIKHVKNKYNCTVMADIALLDEAGKCIDSGADCISTTLSGYTPETKNLTHNAPDIKLLEEVIEISPVPVLAEGRYNTPADAAAAIRAGAWSVIVGTAITRPRIITSWFNEAVKQAGK